MLELEELLEEGADTETFCECLFFWGHVLVLIRTRGEAFWFLNEK